MGAAAKKGELCFHVFSRGALLLKVGGAAVRLWRAVLNGERKHLKPKSWKAQSFGAVQWGNPPVVKPPRQGSPRKRLRKAFASRCSLAGAEEAKTRGNRPDGLRMAEILAGDL